jgi:hypothetical protein
VDDDRRQDGDDAFPLVAPATPRDRANSYRSSRWREIPSWAYPENDRLSNRLVADLPRARRNQLMGDRVDALERLDELDVVLQELASERLALLARLDELRDTLWPADPRSRGRRPPAQHERVLAPADENARSLWGRRLRSMCLAVLRRHGSLPLRDLHDLLHRYGYVIAGDDPVKTLADALGYERDSGRARRVARGIYDVDRRPEVGRRGHGVDPLPGLQTPPDAAGSARPATPPDPDLVDDHAGRISPSRRRPDGGVDNVR